jgi:hypothetical protein
MTILRGSAAKEVVDAAIHPLHYHRYNTPHFVARFSLTHKAACSILLFPKIRFLSRIYDKLKEGAS